MWEVALLMQHLLIVKTVEQSPHMKMLEASWGIAHPPLYLPTAIIAGLFRQKADLMTTHVQAVSPGIAKQTSLLLTVKIPEILLLQIQTTVLLSVPSMELVALQEVVV